MDISKIDKNFEIQTSFEEELVFFDTEKEPFKIYGVFKEGEKFVRLPSEVGKNTNNGVAALCRHTAGGRVRFKTDSVNIAIKAEMNDVRIMTHQAPAGSAGFDLYENDDELGERYTATYRPPIDIKDGFESLAKLNGKKMREITIHFPTYSGVNKLYIGIDPDAKLEAASDYRNDKPVVFYGSSITQGGCVSKPGDTYQDVVSRRFGLDYINLGFSGSARAEKAIYEYINTLDMSIFVYDYDHNAPDPQYLKETHEKMFLAIREKHPTLPIVMMTRPRYIIDADTQARLDIIKETYNNAKARGDENVYLITGRELMAICKTEGTVDLNHPTSLGFFSMGCAVCDTIEKILKKNPEIIKKY